MSYYADNPYDVYADYGVGRYTLLRESFHRARKDHDCATCKSGIKAGAVYRYQFILEEGEKPFALKSCDDCVAGEYGCYQDPDPAEVEAIIRADEAEYHGSMTLP